MGNPCSRLNPGLRGRQRSGRFWALVLSVCLLAVVEPFGLLSVQLNLPGAENNAVDSAEPAPENSVEKSAYVPVLDDVRPSSFKGVTPGSTKLEELERLLGKMQHRREEGDGAILEFRVGPFPQVEATVESGVVVSLVVSLPGPTAIDQVQRELGLDTFSSCTLPNETGDPLGIVFPERGVTLTLGTGAAAGSVLQLLLEPINSESFLRRAEHDEHHEFSSQLADLDYAVKLDPTSAEAHWRRAETLYLAHRCQEAEEAIDRALKLEPRTDVYRLTRAVVLIDLGRGREAAEELQGIVREKESPPYVAAAAYHELANVLAAAPEWKLASALKHRLTAVQFATPLASVPRAVMRRQSRLLLLNIYLSIACDISRGDWRDKPAAIDKWLRGAGEIAEAMIAQDGADESLRFLVQRESVVARAHLDEVDKSFDVQAVVRAGERGIADAADPLYQRVLKRDQARLLFHAACVSLGQHDQAAARDYARKAAALCEEFYTEPESLPRQEEWIGRLYFYLGSACAVQNDNHREAVRWYERALPLLTRTAPLEAGRMKGEYGERLVSMGVSYWGAGARSEALRLTKDGLEAMRESVQAGQMPRRSLSVPYSNLAAMYKLVGNQAESRKMAVLAAKMESDSEVAPE